MLERGVSEQDLTNYKSAQLNSGISPEQMELTLAVNLRLMHRTGDGDEFDPRLQKHLDSMQVHSSSRAIITSLTAPNAP